MLTDEDVCDRMDIDIRTLQRRVKSAPSGLPGEPFSCGVGTKRQQRRWPAEGLEGWWQTTAPKRLAEERKSDDNDVRRKRTRRRRKQKALPSFEETVADLLKDV